MLTKSSPSRFSQKEALISIEYVAKSNVSNVYDRVSQSGPITEPSLPNIAYGRDP